MTATAPPARKKARVAVAVTATIAPPKCPVCFLLLCKSKTCAKGHAICGECFQALSSGISPTAPVCPLCRTQDIWYPNLVLDELMQQQYPQEYTRRLVTLMNWPDLKAYILREIDPEFCYEQTEPSDALNAAMHVSAIRQILKMARVAAFQNVPPFVVPENLSSMVYTFLPITGFCQFGVDIINTHPRHKLKHVLDFACLLYNAAGFFIQGQYFLITCRYRFAKNEEAAEQDGDNLDINESL